MKNFFDLREENKIAELELLYGELHNNDDYLIIDRGVILLKKYLEKQTTYSNNRKEEKARFSVIFESKKAKKFVPSIMENVNLTAAQLADVQNEIKVTLV